MCSGANPCADAVNHVCEITAPSVTGTCKCKLSLVVALEPELTYLAVRYTGFKLRVGTQKLVSYFSTKSYVVGTRKILSTKKHNVNNLCSLIRPLVVHCANKNMTIQQY